MFEYILSGFSIGLAAGLKPGPLGVVVMQQTIRFGLKSGLKASLAPIVTDIPVILVFVILIYKFKSIDIFLSFVSLFGGLFLMWLSYNSIKLRSLDFDDKTASNSLLTTIKINFLSPYPYMFWFGVGGSYIAKSDFLESVLFVIVTLGGIVFSQMAIAFITYKSKSFLESKTYLYIVKFLGVLLLIFGILLLYRSYLFFIGENF